MYKNTFLMKRLVCFLMMAVTLPAVLLLGTGCQAAETTVNSDEYIDIDPDSPWYWNYKGETVLLLGGSWQDNLFNHPVGLEDHLDVLASAGGNYIRNTMSHRNKGNVFAYEQNDEGLFDLDRFNDEYWERFENFLQMTYERDMIVQIEIWDPWDKYEDHQSLGGWSHNPFNPDNNINYTPDESGLPTAIDYPPAGEPTDHPFFRTIPQLNNNELLLQYQQAFMDKLLSFALQYPNILYCMHNETGERVEFGDYWADYVREKADEAGAPIHITDMRRSEDVRSEDHAHIYDNPDRYTFLDISQNNAWAGLGQDHYDNILYVKSRISSYPRPVNNNKNYGSARHGEEESVARMGRIIFAGASGARFHRPHPIEDPEEMYAKSDFGLGLSLRAQKVIQSLRMVTDELDMVHTEPRNDLLGDRSENEAYLLAIPGRQYAAYFPDGGSVTVDLTGEPESAGSAGSVNSGDSNDSGENTFIYRWINVDEAEWSESGQVRADTGVRFTAPGDGHWIVFVAAEN